MLELTDILLRTEQLNSSWSKNSLKLLISEKENATFDWDMESGERWAMAFVSKEFIGYISSIIPLAFCKATLSKEAEKIFGKEIIIISEEDFDNKKWFINPQRLERNSEKLKWIIEEQMLDFEQFSINDFWYATI